MSEAKLLHEYKYATQKSVAVIGIVMFVGCGIFFSYIGWKGSQPLMVIFAVMSFGLCLMSIAGSRSKKKIFVYEDRLEFPKGPLSKKFHVVQLSNVTNVVEVGGGFPTMRIEQKDKKPLLLVSAQMEDKDFYDLLEFMEKLVSDKPVEASSPMEKEKVERKAKFLMWVGILFLPAIVILPRLFMGQLQDTKDWLASLAIIAVIYAGGFLQKKLEKSTFKHARENREMLARPEIKKIKAIWYSIVGGLSFVFAVVAIYLMRLSYEENLSMWPFFNYAIVIVILLCMTLHTVLPKMDGLMAKTDMYAGYFLVGMFALFAFVFLGAYINIKLDQSEGVERVTVLTGEYIPKKNKNDRCYKLKHWETTEEIGEKSYCISNYPSLKDGEEVSIKVHEGYFNLPWYSEVKFFKFLSPENYIKSVEGNELNLRGLDVYYMANKHGKNIWDSYYNRWKKECKTKEASKCRLASYVSAVKENTSEMKELVAYGCEKEDFLSCYNYFYVKGFSKEEKLKAKKIIVKNCAEKTSKVDKSICDYVNQFK